MPTTKTAAHFGPELFTFLRQLKKNNDRTWFEKNKSRYLEHVRDPMLRFIEDLGPGLKKISRHLLADPSPVGGSMFRIYRDVRFAKDKSPYKTAATAQFRHVSGKDVHCPGYYLHLGLDGVHVGSGIWHPDGPTLAKIRDAIVDDSGRWKRLTNSKPFKDGTLTLSGESLKRPPRGYDAEHPLIEDLKRKDYVTFVTLDEKAACAPGFLDQFTTLCRTAKPFMQFIADAINVEF